MNIPPALRAFVLASISLFSVSQARAEAPAVFTTLHTFGSTGDGAVPTNALIRGGDGYFYGTTGGTIFKLTSAGALTTLYRFSSVNGGSNSDGAGPSALCRGADGDFYGTTFEGGLYKNGTVFKVTPAGALTTLHQFSQTTFSGSPNADGSDPSGGLTLGSDGNFYGTAHMGGARGFGTVFKLTPSGTLTTLHSFNDVDEDGNFVDGAYPEGTLARDTAGNFYGMTPGFDEFSEDGSVYEISSAGAFDTVHQFSDDHFPAGVYPSLIHGSDGNLYGTTDGESLSNNGTVFKVTPTGTLTFLHTFTAENGDGDNGDGADPKPGLVQGNDGNFYGLTWHGGASGNGVIYRLTPAGILTTLHSFSATDANGYNSDGAQPYAALVQGPDGSFYGTTAFGGANGVGTIFKLSLPPVITSPATATAVINHSFNYQIAASFNPTSFAVDALPAGLKLSPGTGLISGNPQSAGTFPLTLKATNGAGSGTAKLTLTIKGPPVITNSATADAILGDAFSYRIVAGNAPTSYTASGLRDGLTLDSATGVIAGTPTTAGTVRLTIGASNAYGTGSSGLTITVVAKAPEITSAASAAGKVGSEFSYRITASNGPTSYSATGLRDGLTLNTASGVISGKPTTAGTVRLTIHASNSTGTGSATLTVTIGAVGAG